MKCDLCGNAQSLYQWKGIPNCEGKILCDNCARAQIKGLLEDNGPEYSAEAASHYAEYQKLMQMLNNNFTKEPS